MHAKRGPILGDESFSLRIRAEHKFLWFSASGCDVTASQVGDICIYHGLYKNSRFNNVAERARRMVMPWHMRPKSGNFYEDGRCVTVSYDFVRT